MIQEVDGKEVYVVEFDTMPELPIYWRTDEEKPYALALATAIHTGTITEPGKYGIEFTTEDDEGNLQYQVYRVDEEETNASIT
jgi:hypothetical protein